MKTQHGLWILILGVLAVACDPAVSPDAEQVEPPTPAFGVAQASPHMAASGSYAQTAITSLNIQTAGPNTILEQTSIGSMTGTLSGAFDDSIRVVIHPNGTFEAQFTMTCECTVEGKEGTLEINATDTGELTGPESGTFTGRAVITGGTGELSDLRGVLSIEGEVDVASGLSTTTYSGSIHFQP